MTTFDRPSRALMWAIEMFGPVALEPDERAMRFLEEAVETAHALGVPMVAVQAIVKRVFDRPPGLVPREIGQAQITLEVLAKAIHVNADDEADKEFFRIQAIPKSEWQRRHAAKQAVGTALSACPTCKKHVPSPCVARQNTVECPNLGASELSSQESKCPHSTAGE